MLDWFQMKAGLHLGKHAMQLGGDLFMWIPTFVITMSHAQNAKLDKYHLFKYIHPHKDEEKVICFKFPSSSYNRVNQKVTKSGDQLKFLMESPIITTSNTCVSSLETKIGEGFHFAIFQGKYNFGKMLSFFPEFDSIRGVHKW